MDFDLVIRGGTIVDGTGCPAVRGDVGIRDGRLAALEAGLGEAWSFETFPEYLDAVERRGTALNVAVLLGHTPLRLYVMGEDATERPATDGEIGRMRALVREAIDAGSIGFATLK